MNITLLATSPDGWTLVSEGRSYWLFVPPYRERDKRPLSNDAFQREIADGDYERCSGDFGGWTALIGHICRKRADGHGPTDPDAAVRLLRFADADQVRAHLGRIREALESLLGSEAAKSDTALANEIQGMICLEKTE